MKDTKLFELVTGTETKPWLSRNMLPNINTCGNGWSNFSVNLKVVSLKLLELTQFAWPTLSIYFNFLCAVPRDDVIESPRFLMRPPGFIPPWHTLTSCKMQLFFYTRTNLVPSAIARNLSSPSFEYRVHFIHCRKTCAAGQFVKCDQGKK